MNLPIALQLYSVRTEMARDFEGTLKKVAGIGYKGVEFAGFGGIPAERMKNLLNELGLVPVGSHTALKLLMEKPDEVIEYNLAIGCNYVICPYNEYRSKEDYIKFSNIYNEIGEKIREAGLEFLYHNHDHEFTKYDGEYGLEILFAGTKPENMAAELDAGWVFYAGVDAPAYIRAYKGRCPLIHMKDFSSIDNRNFTEIGNGIIDINAISQAAADAGTQWLIVEHDECSMPELDSVRISFENLKRMKLA